MIQTLPVVKMTPEQFAILLKEAKPYLMMIEDRAAEIGYGSLEIRLEVRAGQVEKMMFFESKTWLKDKSSWLDPFPMVLIH